MQTKFLSAVVSLGLVVGIAAASSAAVVEIHQGGIASFRWASASGPVDHYQIQVATEAQPPFSWSVFGVADVSDPSVSIADGAVGGSWLTIRTVAYDAAGNASTPSPASWTVHFVPPVVRVYSVPDDFDGDSIADSLSHDTATGAVSLVESSTGDVVVTPTSMGADWEIVAQGDFDGDAREDLFWRNVVTGDNRLWLEVGANVIEENFDSSPALANVHTDWQVLASGDFDGDGLFDVLWQNATTLATNIWFMDGPAAEVIDFPRVRAGWVVEASGDFDGSDTFDIFWRNTADGSTAVWLMDGERVRFESSAVADLALQAVNVLDDNADGFMDLVWQRPDGTCELWLMSGGDRLANPAPIGAPACPTPGL